MELTKSGSLQNLYKELPGELNDERTAYELPQITSQNSAGKPQYWRLKVAVFNKRHAQKVASGDLSAVKFNKIAPSYFEFAHQLPQDLIACIIIEYRIGDDGKLADFKPVIMYDGKNKGKKNETSPFTQALIEAYGRYRKRFRSARGKPVSTSTAVKMYPPMAGKRLENYKKGQVDFTTEGPIFVQPKYDGVRLVSTPIMGPDGDVQGAFVYSRFCKEYKQMGHLKAELKALFTCIYQNYTECPVYLDGEFYLHGKKLQDISGISRRELEAKEEALDEDNIHYYIFDVFWPGIEMPFDHRKAELGEYFEHCCPPQSKYLHLAPTEQVKTRAEMDAKYEEYLGAGYEGLILRLPEPYKYSHNNYRSNGIIKVKPDYDAEFKVVDYTTGKKGKAQGVLIFIFETDKGLQFKASMKNVSDPESKALYKKMGEKIDGGQTYFEHKYKGRKLTLTYQDLSKDGKPVRAHVINLEPRDYE